MEGPGMSLFQGAPSIHVNNSAQDRLEEQEELEDQKRRNEELKHKLANAFDDLLDDDEGSSVNSSANFTIDAVHTNGTQQPRTGLLPTYVESLNHLKEQHTPESPKLYCGTPKNHMAQMRHQDDPLKLPFSPYGAGDGQNYCFQQDVRGHLNGMNNFDARHEYMNNEQLKVMYEMRVKECQQLAAQIEKLDSEIDSLRARLAAAVSDRDKADLSLQEAHHLLASSKHKLIELEQQVNTLTEKLVESDQDKEQLKIELRSANISLQDVQQRLHTLQVAHSHDTDALFREQQDRVVPLSKELPIDYEYEEESDFDDTEYTSSCVTSENKRKRHCYDSKDSTYPPDTDVRNDKQYSDNVYNEKYLSKKKCTRNGNKHENFSNLIYNEFINNVCNSSNKRKRHPNEGIHRETAATRTRGQQHNNDDRRSSTTSVKANHRRFDDHASEDTDRTEGNESSEINDNVINKKETYKLFIEEPTHDGRGGAVPSYASAATLAEVKRRALQLLERYEDGRPPDRDHGRRPGQRPVQRSEDERPVQRSEDERPVQRSEDERPVQRAGEERSEDGRPRTRRRRVRRRRPQPAACPPPGDIIPGTAAPGDFIPRTAVPGEFIPGDAGDAAPAPVIRNASQNTRQPRVVRSLSTTSPYDPI